MRVVKTILLISLILILILIAYVAQLTLRFDLFFNPIAREIRSAPNAQAWGDRVELIESQFDQLEERMVVTKKLEAAGFEHIPDAEVWPRYSYEIENGRKLYMREAHNGVCNVKLYVFVSFDESDKLVFAEGTKHHYGCL